jgi:hypothetical protein
MKNRLYLVLGMLLIAALGAVLWWSPWEPREPVYDGKPLSYWLAALGVTPISLKARNSLVSDSNAVPFLIKALQRDSWIGAAVYRKRIWPNLPPSMRRHSPAPADNAQARYNAVVWLQVIERSGTESEARTERPMAKPAVPYLIRALKEDDNVSVRLQVAGALGDIGKGDSNVVPALTVALKDEDGRVRRKAASILLGLDPEAAAKAEVKPPSP